MIFNCDYSRNQSRYTTECIPFRIIPFPGNILAMCQREHDFSHALEEGLSSCNGFHLRLPSFPMERAPWFLCCSWVGPWGWGVPWSTLANPQRVICKCLLWACLSQELVTDCCSHTRFWCLELRLGSCSGSRFAEASLGVLESDCSVHECLLQPVL